MIFDHFLTLKPRVTIFKSKDFKKLSSAVFIWLSGLLRTDQKAFLLFFELQMNQPLCTMKVYATTFCCYLLATIILTSWVGMNSLSFLSYALHEMKHGFNRLLLLEVEMISFAFVCLNAGNYGA